MKAGWKWPAVSTVGTRPLSKLFVLLGVTPEVASEDACKVEHDLSEETFRCIQQYLEKMMEEQKED